MLLEKIKINVVTFLLDGIIGFICHSPELKNRSAARESKEMSIHLVSCLQQINVYF